MKMTRFESVWQFTLSDRSPTDPVQIINLVDTGAIPVTSSTVYFAAYDDYIKSFKELLIDVSKSDECSNEFFLYGWYKDKVTNTVTITQVLGDSTDGCYGPTEVVLEMRDVTTLIRRIDALHDYLKKANKFKCVKKEYQRVI
jgi:hypothetical protein